MKNLGNAAAVHPPENKRITTKLDADTYRKLRQHGLDTAQSNQAIMAKALGEYLARWDAA